VTYVLRGAAARRALPALVPSLLAAARIAPMASEHGSGLSAAFGDDNTGLPPRGAPV